MESERTNTASLPQVFLILADSVLEGIYRKTFQAGRFCAVWCEEIPRWKESLLAFSYNAVVIDLSAFPEGPLEALHALTKLAPEADVIVLSDREDVQTALSAYRMGVTEYFLKPVPPESLAWSIERALRKKQIVADGMASNQDFAIFTASHRIHVAENDSGMRAVTQKCLRDLFGADHSFWVWPATPSETRFEAEYAQPAPQEIWREFVENHPDAVDRAFETDTANHPDHWQKDTACFIPLREKWMGGCVLSGISAVADGDTLRRAEFVIRSLELALENFRRFSEVKQLTYLDDLTNLYNARYLEVATASALQESLKSSQPFSVLFIDIDRFKSVNDSHGHLIGSQLLIDVAHLLKGKMRKTDRLFRYGGDEFIVLLPQTTAGRAYEVAERLRREVEIKKFFVQNKVLQITLSIGVASFPEHGKTSATLLQMADEAMYSGKKSGRNLVFIAPRLKNVVG